jgi:tRNA (uracil-5-)-methyltransferase TRM9
MNSNTAKILCKLNTDFYRQNSSSFSETRQAPWSGWKRGLDVVTANRNEPFSRLSVFDLACGNLRFESFLKKELGEIPLAIYAVDNCEDLVPCSEATHFQSLDIVGALLERKSLAACIEAPKCDLAVSFGFMHHVPGMQNREEVLRQLVRQTKPSGYVMVSFWQFMKNEEMGKKAYATHEEALAKLPSLNLDEGDFLLGWKNQPGVYRYCHSFSETEINQLVEAVKNEARLIARFSSDGRGDNLNTYLIFQVS